MKRVILVVCEGETEETYIDMLKQRYRVPIRIVSKVAGSGLSQRKLDSYRNEMMIHGADKIQTFLMYDMDVESVVDKLKSMDAELLFSNPCIELWYLLHSAECRTELNSSECLAKLKSSDVVWKNYEKSKLTIEQSDILWNNRGIAISRAKTLSFEQNPSSTIYKLLDSLEGMK